MLSNILFMLIILIISTAYILYSSIRMRDMVNSSFEQQRSLRVMQKCIDEFQVPLLDYLSTKSSKALSDLLVISQKTRTLIPAYKGIPSDPVRLEEKELYSVVSKYLDLADIVIDEKRGMDIARYTSKYDDMQILYAYIKDRIDAISGMRFSEQLSGYESFIVTSRDLQFWNLLFIIFISLFLLIYLLHSVEKLTRPMVKLSRTATEISAGNFDVEDVTLSSLDEIDHVVEAFNRMKKDIHAYIEELNWQRDVEKEYMQERVRNMKMEQLLRRMELYTLQAQMNPHFLFNTLNTGMQLAIVEGADRTGEYMEHLAKLFRHNLRQKNVAVQLRHEIEGLEFYFYILGVRFPKNLDLVLDCPKELLDLYTVPVSILQPLVENCIVHAFKGKEGRNSIVVRVSFDSPHLLLSVADNGIGMKQDAIDALLKPASIDNHSEKVMGLENVIQRLYFFFPEDKDVISIRSQEGCGTEVLVRIDTEKPLCIAY